jgi:hypothetical protein
VLARRRVSGSARSHLKAEEKETELLPHHIRGAVRHFHRVGVVVRRVGDRERAAGRYIAAAAVVEVEGGSSAQVGLRSAGEGRTALAAGEEQNAAVLVLVLVAGL